MRKLVLVLSSSLLLLILLTPYSSGEIGIFNDHFSPRYPEAGDTLEIFVTVKDTTLTGVDSVICRVGNETLRMEAYTFPEQENVNWTRGVLFTCSWEVQGGYHNISFLVNDTLGNTTVLDSGILVIETEDEKDDTIFGLPKTYCAISVIFITLIIIFITWSYFKGKKMQKEMVDNTGSSLMSCSACGARISHEDISCPKCGAQFDEEEHVCGSCGEVISPDDEKCSKCGIKLKTALTDPRFIPMEKKDQDLEKLGKKIDMKGKVKCANCGTVYLKKEKVCPQCQEE